MIQESLFNIPCWKIQIINFEEKKKKLTKLLESYPEKKDPTRKLQAFTTNRQSDRSGLAEQFASIMNEEMEDISKEIKNNQVIKTIQFEDKGKSYSFQESVKLLSLNDFNKRIVNPDNFNKIIGSAYEMLIAMSTKNYNEDMKNLDAETFTIYFCFN